MWAIVVLQKHITDSFFISSINNLLSPSTSLPSSCFVCMFLNITMKQWRAQSGTRYLKRVHMLLIIIVNPVLTVRHVLVMQETDDTKDHADLIMTNVIPLGQWFYPSESSFPLRSWFDLFSRHPLKFSFLLGFIATLLVRFTLANKNMLTPGWAARVLIQCDVQFGICFTRCTNLR